MRSVLGLNDHRFLRETLLDPSTTLFSNAQGSSFCAISRNNGRILQHQESCSNFVLKFGPHVSLSEAHTLEFVSKNSHIPVPRVITAYESESGYRYILMSRIRGVPLSSVFSEFSEEKQRNIPRQLRNYINELRALRPPEPGYVGAVDLTPSTMSVSMTDPSDPLTASRNFIRRYVGALRRRAVM